MPNNHRFFHIQHQRFKRLNIVRHAESTWNLEMRAQGQYGLKNDQPSIQLTPSGRASIIRIKTENPPNIVIASPLKRTTDTAELLYDIPFNQIILNPALLEINAGIYEGRLIKELKTDSFWQQWMSDPLGFPGFPNGESLLEFADRVLHGAARICAEHCEPGLDVNAVTHGVVMRVYKCYLADEDLTHLWQHQVGNLEHISVSPQQMLTFHPDRIAEYLDQHQHMLKNRFTT